ncbi:RHS repeat-associated core domain-containing protein [Chloroflexota bacterium]
MADNENDYLYGNSRIAEQDQTNTEFFMGDALGSVRQLVNGAGMVTLAKSYQPYGETLDSIGPSESDYAFTGEAYDSYITDGLASQGLIYLRSRYYAPYLNQWIQRDPIVPNPYIPADFNRYSYVRNNPVKYTDPSGMCIDEDLDGKCDGHGPLWPKEIDPNQLSVQITQASTRRARIREIISEAFECYENFPGIPTGEIRVVTARVLPYIGTFSFTYNLSLATKPIPKGDMTAMRLTGEESVAIRSVLTEIGGHRMRYNIHSVAEGMGILYTAINRTRYSSWGCTSLTDCILASTQYALTKANVYVGWDPLCQDFYGKCASAYGGMSDLMSDDEKLEIMLDSIDYSAQYLRHFSGRLF